MLAFTLRRLAVSIPVVIASSFIVFVLVATAGGDPLADLRLRPGVTEEVIELRRQQLNLDKPVLERYGIWVKDVVRGDLGRSFTNEEVRPLLFRRLGVTLRLVVFATPRRRNSSGRTSSLVKERPRSPLTTSFTQMP